MIRSSSHTLKFSNKEKLNSINNLFRDYTVALQQCINLILSKELLFKKFMSSKDLPNFNNIKHSQWKQIIYKNAIEIVKSGLKKTKNKTYKKYKKIYYKCRKANKFQKFLNKGYNELNIDYFKRIPNINIKDTSINIDQRLFNIRIDSKTFDKFIKIRLPYFYENKKRARSINIPVKEYRHSLKFKNWDRKKTIKLCKNQLIFTYEKENKLKQNDSIPLGIDLGYKKLISTSTGNFYGKELLEIYTKLSRKQQGSKNFKQILIERDKLINQFCNELNNNEEFTQLIIESLKNVKHKSKKKIYKKIMNKTQRWSYPKVINKLERLSEEEGFLLKKVNPAYTSQCCSFCGTVDKKSRNGENFTCTVCGMNLDADYNAALNILHRGVYNPSVKTSEFY